MADLTGYQSGMSEYPAREAIGATLSGHKNRICIWTEFDVKQYEEFGELPNCNNHDHFSRDKASKMVSNVLFSKPDPRNTMFKVIICEAEWVKLRGVPRQSAIMLWNPRTWATRQSAGYSVKQFVSS
jgi:hypothetical protein